MSEETIGENVKKAQYAIRGAVFLKSQELEAKLAKGENLPFKKLYPCNIGDPLNCGQKICTFNREVYIYIYI